MVGVAGDMRRQWQMQALALAKLKTLGDGYGGGATRLTDLGMQFVLEVPMQSGWDGREYAMW